MSRRILGASALTIAGVVGAGGLAVVSAAATFALAAPDVSGWKTYRNRQTGLEFRYPADYLVKELSRPDGRPIVIGLRSARGGHRDWLLSARVEEMNEWREEVRPGDTAAILRLSVDMAKLQCAGDGPDSSVSCPDVLKTTRFTTASGRAGLEIYLAEVSERHGGQGEPDKSETRTKGPIYAIDISTTTAARVLFFTAPERAASHEHRDILRAVVDTVRIAKGS